MQDERGACRSGGGELAGVQEDDRWAVAGGERRRRRRLGFGAGCGEAGAGGEGERRGWGWGAAPNELGLGRPLPRPRRAAYIRHGPLTGRPFFAGRVVPRHRPRHGLLRAAGRHAPVSNRAGPCSDQAELPCHGPCLGPTGCMHIFT